MKRLLIVGGIAALAVALAGAPLADAQPALPRTPESDQAFYDAVTNIGWAGDRESLISTGLSVCAAIDRGAEYADIDRWLLHEFDNTHDNTPGTSGYYTTVFVQLSAVFYCPWTEPMEWRI